MQGKHGFEENIKEVLAPSLREVAGSARSKIGFATTPLQIIRGQVMNLPLQYEA